MISHLNKLAVALASDLTKNFIIRNVSEGVSESTSFMYEAEYESITIENGQQLQFAKMHTISAVGLVDSGIDTNLLNQMNGEKVYVSAVGPDGLLYTRYEEPIYMEILEHPDSGNFWKFKLTQKTVPWADPETGVKSGLFVGENALSLAIYEPDLSAPETILKGWEIENTQNIASNFQFDVANDEQLVDITGGQGGQFVYGFMYEIFFPFDEILTFSVEFVNVPPAIADWLAYLESQYRSEAGSTGTANIVSITDTPERQELYINISQAPPNSEAGLFIKVQLKFFLGDAAGDLIGLSFKNPDLRVGQIQGSDINYTRY